MNRLGLLDLGHRRSARGQAGAVNRSVVLRPRRLAPEQMAILATWVKAGPDAAKYGLSCAQRRGRCVGGAAGPERIAPEWWLDDPDWRSGPRDYWRVVTDTGDRLWLFFAHGADLSPGWFCHGRFG
jgi:hypothetical protein